MIPLMYSRTVPYYTVLYCTVKYCIVFNAPKACIGCTCHSIALLSLKARAAGA